MSFLESAPPEIISQIFQDCLDFKTVVSLGSTCKHIRSIWVLEAPVIIWELGRSSIVAFESALLAVRATSLVLEAQEKGELPPAISLEQLSGSVQKPTWQELLKILDLRHLVRCIEHIFTLPSNYEQWFLSDWRMHEAPPLSEVWSPNFQNAVYRVFIAGAYCAHACQEPFFVAKEEGGSGHHLSDISTVAKELFRKPGRPNQRGESLAPHPPLQLFSCILKRGLHLRFADDFAEIDEDEQYYYAFTQEGGIFNEVFSEQFACLIDEADSLPELSFGCVY